MNILIPQLAPQYLADVGPGRTDHSRKQPPATAEPYAGLLLQRFYSLAKILCRTIVCFRGNDVKIITFRVLCVIRGKKFFVSSVAILMNILIPQLAPQYLADVGLGQFIRKENESWPFVVCQICLAELDQRIFG